MGCMQAGPCWQPFGMTGYRVETQSCVCVMVSWISTFGGEGYGRSTFFSTPDTPVATAPTTGGYASRDQCDIIATSRGVAAVPIVSAIVCLTIDLVGG